MYVKEKDRVQLHPGTDLWMRGARFGTVVKVGRNKRVQVLLDVNDRVVWLHQDNVNLA